MKVLLEGTQALRRYRGWGRYNLEVLLELSAAGAGLELKVFYNRHGLDDCWLSELLRGRAELWPLDHEPDEYRRIEEDFERSFIDESFPDIDVYHAVTEFPFFTRRAKLVTSIHEVTALVHPENFDPRFLAEFSKYVRYDVERSDLLLTGSKSTATELIDLCGADPSRVRVIEYGVNSEFLADRPTPVGTGSPYISYVGSVLDRNKCFELLLRAFAEIDSEIGLAIVTNEVDLAALGRRFQIAESTLERIRILPDITDRELADLYRASALFVFPACHEGFGLPLAEAMACRCPVLYADNSALIEVGAGHGITFATNDAADLSDKLTFCLSRYPRDDLEAARAHVAGRYTWDRTARGYVAAYRELVG